MIIVRQRWICEESRRLESCGIARFRLLDYRAAYLPLEAVEGRAQ